MAPKTSNRTKRARPCVIASETSAGPGKSRSRPLELANFRPGFHIGEIAVSQDVAYFDGHNFDFLASTQS
jgi:hypothetical protein